MIPSYKAGRRLGGANRRDRRDRSEFRELVSRRLAREGFGESTPVTPVTPAEDLMRTPTADSAAAPVPRQSSPRQPYGPRRKPRPGTAPGSAGNVVPPVATSAPAPPYIVLQRLLPPVAGAVSQRKSLNYWAADCWRSERVPDSAGRVRR